VDHTCLPGLGLDRAAMGLGRLAMGLAGGILVSRRLGLLVLGSVSAAAVSAADPAPGVADCATVTASARMQAYGYAHVVTLANRCSRPVSCEVWTNVDPSPHLTVQAKPGQSAEVVTRAGSPAREFSAGKQCRFDTSG
jgi:hypothetical protein